MKYFLPPQKDEKLENKAYDAIKKFAKETTGWDITDRTTGWDITDRKIYHIKYRHEGKDYEAKIGERETRQGETVIAILESTVTFLVCTPNRGVKRGMPILVGKEEIISITDFEK